MNVFKWEYFLEAFPKIIEYLPITFVMIGLSLLAGLVLAFLLTLMKLGKNKWAKKIADGYTTIVRCTPSIVMLFLVYYGIPDIVKLFGKDINDWNRLFFVVITYALLTGGNMSEVMRSAYLSIPEGQLEAAYCCGLNTFQAMYRIILPQALMVALPNLGNSIIGLLKSGSLAYTIGFVDIMGQSVNIISRRMGTFPLSTYLALALIYWGICIFIEQVINGIEKHTERKKQRAMKEAKA